MLQNKVTRVIWIRSPSVHSIYLDKKFQQRVNWYWKKNWKSTSYRITIVFITHDFSYYNSIPENEFLAKFPYEPYGGEYKKEESYTVVYETEFDLSRSNQIKLPNTANFVGKYKLEAISIVAEDTIRSERFMEIINNKLQSDEKSPLMVTTDKVNYQISDLAKIMLKTDFDFLHLNMTSSEDEK